MQRQKRENDNGDEFNKTVYGKLKNDPDGKLGYVKGLYEETGQLRFDLEFFNEMVEMYTTAGLNRFELEDMNTLAKYIQDGLASLKKVILEMVVMENKAEIDNEDLAAVQDKALRLESLN